MHGLAFYRQLNEALAATIAGSNGFAEHVQKAPVILGRDFFQERQNRRAILESFFSEVLQIFREVIAGTAAPLVSSLLLNDVHDAYGVAFHKSLPAEVWTTPRFFRTDESKNGSIFEIQCPGSGWGDLPLLATAYRLHASVHELTKYEPSALVAQEVIDLCGNLTPCVLHLLDNSSNPSSMRYLMATTQPPLRYWGYEPSVRIGACQFVRSHSFYGLVAENLFGERVRDAAKGKVKFDLPPILVFDQKAPLCLPFLDETKDRFSDAVRAAITYSYPLTERGFRDVTGDWIDCESFLKRRPSQRKYFLKYGGCDVSINWGSRSVYRLNDHEAPKHVEKAAGDARAGRYWVIQPEISEKEDVTYFDKASGKAVQERLTAKYSSFYGPTKLIGVRSMHRKHYKVHGQEDTVLGLVMPPSGDSE